RGCMNSQHRTGWTGEITGKDQDQMALADEATRFKPGQLGNSRGRPRGSRHRLSELALKALCADFEAGGAEAIERCRREHPDVYVRVVASLLPKQTDDGRPRWRA